MIARPTSFGSNRPPFAPVSVPPRYVPHMAQPKVLAMGLKRLESETIWLDPEADRVHWRGHKLERRWSLGGKVWQVLPSAIDAACELADWVAGEPFTPVTAEGLRRFRPEERLWQASLAVPEDLVIMVPDGDTYRLGAASLCSPSHWRLEEKIGRTMREIHDPIPGIHDVLSPRIDRFFATQREDFPIERYNWALQDDAELYALPGHSSAAVSADAPLWYRVERQTLRRLPVSGALAFTIRVYMNPLASLQSVDGAIPALLDAIDATPPALAEYKSFDRYAPALARWRA
jgi:hypothetical protein